MSCDKGKFKVGDKVVDLYSAGVGAVASPVYGGICEVRWDTGRHAGKTVDFHVNNLRLIPEPARPKVGDKIKVTGTRTITVDHYDSLGRLYSREVSSPTGVPVRVHPDDPCVTIEILEPAEPEYVAGEWYRAAGGAVYMRTVDRSWLLAVDGARRQHSHPARPLVRLVPEGQQ